MCCFPAGTRAQSPQALCSKLQEPTALSSESHTAYAQASESEAVNLQTLARCFNAALFSCSVYSSRRRRDHMLNPPPTPLQKYHRRLPNLHNRDEMASAALVSIVTAHICLASPCIFPSFIAPCGIELPQISVPTQCLYCVFRTFTEARASHAWTTLDHRALSINPMCDNAMGSPCCRCPLKGGKVFHSFHVARGAFGACVPLRSMWL